MSKTITERHNVLCELWDDGDDYESIQVWRVTVDGEQRYIEAAPGESGWSIMSKAIRAYDD